MRHFTRRYRITGYLCLMLLLAVRSLVISAQDQKKPEPKDTDLPGKKKQALAVLRKELPAKSEYFSYGSADLDGMLATELRKLGRAPGPPVSDAAFVRRAYLDITGKLPAPDAIYNFVGDSDPKKRSKLIETLLNSDAYARNWARYWRDVMLYNVTTDRRKYNAQALEDWLFDQFKKDRGWDQIAAELVMADGKKQEERRDNFWLAHDNSPTQMAAETARVFMGINVQCAECHDHPFDQWKREQFHHMAAFFAKDKYYMPDAHDPAKKTEMKPKFLLGQTPNPKAKLQGDDKRIAVAAYLIYDPKNYWFARSYVNRVWNELFGDGFYKVDSLGPDGEVIFPTVVNRLSAAFRAMNFKPKWLFRTIMNSDAYARETQTPASASDRFATLRPTRLRGDQVADLVTQVLGDVKARDRIAREFSFDPSIPQEDIDGSIQQALALMNNPSVQQRIVKVANEMAKINPDDALIKETYVRVLAREPSETELQRMTRYFQKVGRRGEAIEDLIWTLVNSAEFTTKR
jgi:Protein of unknown function (DUF1549)/Protein of unknown function (DUF1553)